MLSESARMSSAAEARFRLAGGASVARAVTVIGLDPGSDRLLDALAAERWDGVRFLPAFEGRDGWLDEVTAGDLLVMVVTAGTPAHAAPLVGRACSDRRVHTATIVVRPSGASDEGLSATLAEVRPWSLMVVIVGDAGYVGDLLRSFR